MTALRWVAVLAFLVLAACRPAPPSSSAAPEPGGTAAVDPCPLKYARVFCGNKQVEDAAVRMREAFSAEIAKAGDLSEEARAVFNRNQQSWLAAQAKVCGVDLGAGQLTEDQAACVNAALAERVKQAAAAIEQKGPFRFQRVEENSADVLKPAQLEELNLPPGAPNTAVQALAYPQIIGQESPATEKFNALAKQERGSKPGEATEETVNYEIVYAGPALISVRFDKYMMTLGAAHPNTGAAALNFNLRTQEKLKAADVFVAGSGWEKHLAARAAKAITASLRESGSDANVTAADAMKSATDPANWLITPKGLTLVFPPYSFSEAPQSGPDVELPWSELKRFLRADAPEPIKA